MDIETLYYVGGMLLTVLNYNENYLLSLYTFLDPLSCFKYTFYVFLVH